MADTLPPLSLYIHTPWCVRKCPYCDFNSHEPGTHGFTPRDLPEAAYLDALLQDLDSDLDLAAGREIKTIFIGGGTPSLMSPAFYERLLKEIQIRLPFSKEIEITLEANPGTTEQERFIGYRKAGINRLSLGIQSFQPDQLHALGRIHSGDEAITAVAQARQAGFTNINIDLMHGLPDQTPQLAMDDITQALALAPEHLSWYQLTLEPNTAFHSHPRYCQRKRRFGIFRIKVISSWSWRASSATRSRLTLVPVTRAAITLITGSLVTTSGLALVLMASLAVLTQMGSGTLNGAGKLASQTPT